MRGLINTPEKRPPKTSSRTAKVVNWVEASCCCCCIQKRILAICKTLPRQPRETRCGIEVARRKPLTLTHKLEQKGHDIIFYAKRYQCMKCMKDWTNQSRTAILQLGECAGISQWGGHQPDLGAPTKVKLGNQIHFAGACVHPSHHLAWHRGVC